jgi:hypothetical protein
MRKKITSKSVSIVASIAIFGLIGFSGCSNSYKGVSNSLDGVAIDGYVSGATVCLDINSNGVCESTELTTQTLADGTFSFPGVAEGEYNIIVSGGTDTATGEPFEGVMSAISSASGNVNTVVTPLSSLVASLVKTGLSKAAAQKKVADQLNISEETLTSDPIATLNSTTATAAQKDNAAKAIKQALVIQKTAEIFAKSVSNGNSATSNAVMASVMKAIAASMNSGKTFEQVMANTNDIATTVGNDLSANTSVTTDTNFSAKLTASAVSAQSVADIVGSMNTADLITAASADVTKVLEAKSKAIEVVTSAIEKKVAAIAIATTTATIATAKETAVNTVKAVTMLGGVDGVTSRITVAINAATIAGTSVKASTYETSFITTEIVTAQSNMYNQMIGAGITDVKTILSIGSKFADAAVAAAANGSTVDAGTMSDIIKEATTTITIDTTKLNELASSAATTTNDTTKAADSAAAEAGNTTSVVVIRTPLTCQAGDNLDNLSSAAYMTSSDITVDCISDATLGSNYFSLEKTKINYTPTGYLDTDFTAIQGSLAGMLDIQLKVDATTVTALDKNVLMTVLVKNPTNSSYVAVATNAHFTTSAAGTYSVTAPAGNLLRMGTSIQGTTLTATKTNVVANAVTSTDSVMNISATKIINEFAGNTQIGNTIKQYMVDYTTKAGTYDVYLLINDTTTNASFVGTNSVTVDATSLNTLVAGSGVTYTSSAKAVKVHLTVK